MKFLILVSLLLSFAREGHSDWNPQSLTEAAKKLGTGNQIEGGNADPSALGTPSDSKKTSAADSGVSNFKMEQFKEDCTIEGEVSKLCIEFNKTVYINDAKYETRKNNPKYADDLIRCFSEAKGYVQAKKSRSQSTGSAVMVYETAPRNDPYVQECFKVTDKVVGSSEWKKQSDNMAAMKVYYDDLKDKIAKNFPKVCEGAIAASLTPGRPRLTVEPRTRSKKIFSQTKGPDGGTDIVYCSGDIKTISANGSSVITEGEGFEKSNSDMQNGLCMVNCASSKKSLACSRANGSLSDSACKDSCKPQCGGG